MKTKRVSTVASKRPVCQVQLSDADGNAAAIIGLCARAARRAGWTAADIDAFRVEAKAGDYDNVLATAMKWFDVL